MFIEKLHHLERAKELFAAGDPDSLRYCSLELRFCLEILAYEQVELHEKELPEEVFRVWQPKRVIEELLAFDPDVEKDYTVSGGFEGPAGETPKQMIVLGDHKALTRKLISKPYHKLGNFLHAPTIAQLRGTKPASDLKAAISTILPEVEVLCSSTVNSNLGVFISFDCQDCKQKIVRNLSSLSPETIVTCTKSDCGATHRVSGLETSTPSFQLVQEEFECPACSTKNFLSKHRFRHGLTITCVQCPKKFSLKLLWHISEATSSPSAT